VAASLADIVDGPIARSTPGRHPAFAAVGSKLDCYSDIVSHFVVPASLLMHFSDLSAVCTALAALYVCAGILRHVSSSCLVFVHISTGTHVGIYGDFVSKEKGDEGNCCLLSKCSICTSLIRRTSWNSASQTDALVTVTACSG